MTLSSCRRSLIPTTTPWSVSLSDSTLMLVVVVARDDDDGVVLSFHWGGRPIVLETAGDYFTAELVLATLHHGMIASNITVGGGGE